MKKHSVKSNVFLFITAIIWGFAFIAQKVGMKFLGPYTFNGVRFTLGSISLVPILLVFKNRDRGIEKGEIKVFKAGTLSGLILFLASSFQQVGLETTTAGKAAFITGLYIVIVPIFSIFLKRHIAINSWIGAIISVIGLYFLCVKTDFTIEYSDFLELISGFLFAVQIMLIDNFANRFDAIKLAFYQFLTCAVFSLLVAIFRENISFSAIRQGAVPILYGGIMSVGVAYTFQILGQKDADPNYASIIMSMETVFAAIGGFILLGEYMEMRQIIGCIFMFIGIILSQSKLFRSKHMVLNS